MVAGLGNPGKRYQNTRHNVGFAVVDALASRLQLDAWKTKDGARQLYDPVRQLVLMEPQTFMNNSGVPIRLVASWYRAPAEKLLVIYDDMDIPFGTIRLRPFGGHGGHNGMRSIVATMGDRFPRLRVGLGRSDEEDSIDRVLSPFTKEERDNVPAIVGAAVEGVQLWLSDGIDAAMRFVNTWRSEIAEDEAPSGDGEEQDDPADGPPD